MEAKNGWLLVDAIEPRALSVVMVGGRVRSGVAWRSVVTRNHDQILGAVLGCCRSKTTVREEITASRAVTAVPVIEPTDGRVHGVWVCTHQGGEPESVPSPSWAFLWNLAEGFAYRGDPVGMESSWAELGVPARRPIADSLRMLAMGEHNTTVLAGLARKTGGNSVDRYTVDEHRPGGDRRVHVVAHSVHETARSHAVGDAGVHLVRGLSIDIGVASEPPRGQVPALGDRIAEALTPPRQYRAISDPETLNLLYWHGPPAPRIAWMADNTAEVPILHPDDMPTALDTASALRVTGPGRTVDLTLRFLTLDGVYEPFDLTASLIDLDSGHSALLVVLTVK